LPADAEFLAQLVRRPIGREINLDGFDCNEAINWFLKNKACELHEKRVNTATCWLHGDDVVGYVTTSMTILQVQSSGQREKAKLQGAVQFREGGKQYDKFPAMLIGVLGVCQRYRRKGVGEAMVRYVLGQALRLNDTVGCRFVTVDSEPSAEATGLYEKCGFERLEKAERKGASAGREETVAMYYDLVVQP
jgi:ribosomal protein S18 acetylase RimI-like enzyme